MWSGVLATLAPHICKADPNLPGPNYGKDHAAVQGIYDSEIRMSCIFCGKWLGETGDESAGLHQFGSDV